MSKMKSGQWVSVGLFTRNPSALKLQKRMGFIKPMIIFGLSHFGLSHFVTLVIYINNLVQYILIMDIHGC